MFVNDMTKKMRCWKCRSFDDGKCPILKTFLECIPSGVVGAAGANISGLKFDCREYRENLTSEDFQNIGTAHAIELIAKTFLDDYMAEGFAPRPDTKHFKESIEQQLKYLKEQ